MLPPSLPLGDTPNNTRVLPQMPNCLPPALRFQRRDLYAQHTRAPNPERKTDTAHRGADRAVIPTDEGDQDGHFFFNHPERGGYSAA